MSEETLSLTEEQKVEMQIYRSLDDVVATWQCNTVKMSSANVVSTQSLYENTIHLNLVSSYWSELTTSHPESDCKLSVGIVTWLEL